ncbi:hypothetical protein DL89DRAFT_265056 [Linderina pennispora]|uniref:RPA43 OB domain-containing protein n=1 Tax=Linderina pennispora TaxID=61395 RepID=A0A1Y1WID1_9FUNG|nr:uncharacterized protein DL89DRAFT_265056 [Linderina pennispora]ORX72874.1 hypothetical protein DL89DRAFT_265056 [Linderina pennispora]
MGEKRRKSADKESSKKHKKSKKHSSTTASTEKAVDRCRAPPHVHPPGSSRPHSDFSAGVHETLNSMLLHYVPQVRGVVLSYSKARPLSDTGPALDVVAKLLLWRPIGGMSVKGRINVQSPDHIGLLLWDTFNASIPASYIPKDKYEWRAFDDEEIAARATTVATKSESDDSEESEDKDESEETPEEEQPEEPAAAMDFGDSKFGSGEWFVIVDVIRANEVLSVTGALL